MKLPPRKTITAYFVILTLGIVIGSQIPGIISDIRFRKMERQALKQLEKYPDEASSWLLISQYRWRRGDEKGSFEAAHKALELDPNYVLAIEKIAYNYWDMGELENARTWLERALKAAESHAPGQIEMIRFSLSQIEKEMQP